MTRDYRLDVENVLAELNEIEDEDSYLGHTPACQGEPGCPLCRALTILRGYFLPTRSRS